MKQRGIPLQLLGRIQVAHELAAWEAYLARAKAMGYSQREAKAVVAGLAELARRIPGQVDVLDIAELVLARGDIEK